MFFSKKQRLLSLFISWIPVRFFSFATVGLTGAVVHLSFLTLLHQWLLLNFLLSQTLATFLAITNNYFLNNVFTFRNQRHSGKQQLVGLLSFYLACSVGAVINLQCAAILFQQQMNWAIAGFLGGVSGSLWNFFTAKAFIWKKDGNANFKKK